MSEAENLQRAMQADYELKLTDAAFANLRERYTAEAINAKTAEDAFAAVMRVRSLEAVQQQLRSIIDTQRIDKIGKD